MQNESETEFHNVRKFVLTQQLLKSLHLLMESGSVGVPRRSSGCFSVATRVFTLRTERNVLSASWGHSHLYLTVHLWSDHSASDDFRPAAKRRGPRHLQAQTSASEGGADGT